MSSCHRHRTAHDMARHAQHTTRHGTQRLPDSILILSLRAPSPVHVTKWSLDNVHIFSSSDDKTVRYWDLPTEKEIQIMKGHQVWPMPLARVQWCAQ